MNEFELERELSRSEVATYLRKLADGLEQDNKVTFVVGDESATINPPEHVHARMETNTDSSWLGGDNGQSFLLELGWEAVDVQGDQELTIITQPRSSRVSDDDHEGDEDHRSDNDHDRRDEARTEDVKTRET